MTEFEKKIRKNTLLGNYWKVIIVDHLKDEDGYEIEKVHTYNLFEGKENQDVKVYINSDNNTTTSLEEMAEKLIITDEDIVDEISYNEIGLNEIHLHIQ